MLNFVCLVKEKKINSVKWSIENHQTRNEKKKKRSFSFFLCSLGNVCGQGKRVPFLIYNISDLAESCKRNSDIFLSKFYNMIKKFVLEFSNSSLLLLIFESKAMLLTFTSP
jgi:hypothetical protein